MVQPKRFLPRAGQEEGERPKRQNSGDLRRRSRKLSSEEEEYTTDETSDEEEEDPTRPSSSSSSGGRKSSKPPRRWQASEDRRLAESVKLHGEANWKAIASKVGSRNHVQCLQRWKKVLRPGLVKGQWSSEEDAVLMKLATSGYKNWGVLSNHMPGRTSKQCRERWCHHLNPTINKGAYSPEEDKIIVETQARLGNKWSQIAARLPGRTENSIKIRCKALQRKGTSGGGGGGAGGSGRGGGGGGRSANSFGANRKSAVSSSSRSRASSGSSAASAQSCASAADSVGDEPMPEACRDVALLPELCPTAFPNSIRRRAASVVVKCEAPGSSSSLSPPLSSSPTPPPPNLSASAGGGGGTTTTTTLFSAPHSPSLFQRRPGKGKALQLSANSIVVSNGGGGGPARTVRTPPAAPAPAPPPSPMPAALDGGNHGRWRLWPKASATTANNHASMRHSMSAPHWSTPVVVAPTAAGAMKEEFSHQRLPPGGSFLDYVPPERSSSVSGIGGGGGGVGFEGVSYAPMSGSSRSMSMCGALAQQSLQLQQQQQLRHQHQHLQQQLQQQQQQTEPLSHFFEYGLNAVMGQASAAAAAAPAPVTPEQGQGCALPPRGFAAGPAGLPLFVGGGLLPQQQQVMGRAAASEHAAAAAAAVAVSATTADKEEGEAVVFGDFNALGVDDLKAAVGGEDDDEDDAAAPLRSCCSFLDLPAEGMVVGDMPLSW